MNILEILTTGGGQNSLGKLAGLLGLGTTDIGSLLNSVTPALTRGLQRQMQSPEGLSAVKSALGSGNHQRYLDNPDLMTASNYGSASKYTRIYEANKELIPDPNKIYPGQKIRIPLD